MSKNNNSKKKLVCLDSKQYGGHHMTILDVKQMEFSDDDLRNGQAWLEKLMLGDTQDAVHARVVYAYATSLMNALPEQSGSPIDSSYHNISYMLSPTGIGKLGNRNGD